MDNSKIKLYKEQILDFPNKFGVFTRLGSWIKWPAKRDIHDNQSPPHHPSITSLGANKPKASETLVMNS